MSTEEIKDFSHERHAKKMKDNEEGLDKFFKEPRPGFGPGNELWRLAKNFLRPDKIVDNAEQLLDKCLEYFQWAEENTLSEAKLVSFQGDSKIENVPKMRAMTIRGLCLFVGCNESTWKTWRAQRPEFKPVIEFAENYMYQRKFDGAAAGLLNPNIIARDLGLVDRTEVSGPNGAPLQQITTTMTPQEASEAYAATLNPSQD